MALRDINLIPADILDRKAIRRHLTFWTLCLGICLSPVFGFYIYQTAAAAAQKQGPSNATDIDRQLTRQIAKITAIQAEIATLNQQLEDFKTVLKPAIFSKILHKLAGTMNGYTWLDSLQIHRDSGSGKTIRLQMKGYAGSNGALGDFLNRLSGDPETENVVLKYAKEGAGRNTPEATDRKFSSRIEFEIECTISEES